MRTRFPSVEACRLGKRKLVLWDPGDPAATFLEVPWRCKSWRCPRCRPAVALRDYNRLCWALEREPRWIYLVLTAPPELHRQPPVRSFRALGEAWRKRLRHRIVREHGKVLYIQTWERHKSGVAHVNIALRTESLIADAESRGVAWRGWLLEQARQSGFGRIGFAGLTWDPVPNARHPLRGLASYMTKQAHALGLRHRGGKISAELARADIKDQTPLTAPRGFRRLRASRGVLPPKPPSDWTGVLAGSGERWTPERVVMREALGRLTA